MSLSCTSWRRNKNALVSPDTSYRLYIKEPPLGTIGPSHPSGRLTLVSPSQGEEETGAVTPWKLRGLCLNQDTKIKGSMWQTPRCCQNFKNWLLLPGWESTEAGQREGWGAARSLSSCHVEFARGSWARVHRIACVLHWVMLAHHVS